MISLFYDPAPEINISPVPDIVSGSLHFVPVTRDSCQSSVYDIVLKFENLSVNVNGRKRILSVTYEIMPGGDRWPAVISCTVIWNKPHVRPYMIDAVLSETLKATLTIKRPQIWKQNCRQNIQINICTPWLWKSANDNSQPFKVSAEKFKKKVS